MRQFGLALLFILSAQQDSSKVLSAFSVPQKVLSGEKASFLPPLALLGYIPIPTFCSYCPQTPSTKSLVHSATEGHVAVYLRFFVRGPTPCCQNEGHLNR